MDIIHLIAGYWSKHLKVPNLEHLITLYEQSQTRKGYWEGDPSGSNKCLECRSALSEHVLMTIEQVDTFPLLALVCPDYVDKYRRHDSYEDTVIVI